MYVIFVMQGVIRLFEIGHPVRATAIDRVSLCPDLGWLIRMVRAQACLAIWSRDQRKLTVGTCVALSVWRSTLGIGNVRAAQREA